MNSDETNMYKEQLQHINQALAACPQGTERQELLVLKGNIEELLSLTEVDENMPNEPSTSSHDVLSSEYALFMAELERDGAVECKRNVETNPQHLEELKKFEGMKCRAPHTHQWGQTTYHNAMISSVVSEDTNPEDARVRVLFTNPTHQEMLACPYYYTLDCKFSEEMCRFSHGEIVLFSGLQEYIEPNFELLGVGSHVLVKQADNLWYRGIIKKAYDEKYLVKFESNKKEVEVVVEHILPLNKSEDDQSEHSSNEEGDKREEVNKEDVINRSLMVTPSGEAIGEWEKYTKGMGSRLMQKMGYVVGTGLGKNGQGRVNPVTAVILPPGKSLDHCMNLREQAGGDANLFNVEKKLHRLHKRQDRRNEKAARKREKKEPSVFNVINKALAGVSKKRRRDKVEDRKNLKKECSRNLNIQNLQIADNIKKAERDLGKLRDSLARHSDVTSNIHLKLKDKLVFRQDQLKMYQTQSFLIRTEQNCRDNKRKMTTF